MEKRFFYLVIPVFIGIFTRTPASRAETSLVRRNIGKPISTNLFPTPRSVPLTIIQSLKSIAEDNSGLRQRIAPAPSAEKAQALSSAKFDGSDSLSGSGFTAAGAAPALINPQASKDGGDNFMTDPR